ncbi:hypothetical protein A8990_1426 [Paenibacillus taihuensis]|uniref:Uncharacterized protein n=1 Tax=Paenibacillus taihuensis TaxID=1156355 RepID=A0A3D9QUA8_9BACL|nr:hypothetical protein [Paenibacillus taihuensis]REE67579.1 hypothetical protein A8990_1426 [Paenibacillus taihuensis]
MIKNKAKLFSAIGLSAVLLVGAASAYAAQQQQEVQVQQVGPTTDKKPTAAEVDAVLKGEHKPATIKVEGMFSSNGKPDPTADYFLNDVKLFSLLKMSAQELKDELATGKSVLEIAASRHVTEKEVIEAISETQIEGQIQAENKGEVPKSKRDSLEKDIAKKVAAVIEHKTETSWNK